jgi:hypothetical protein
MLNDVRLLNPYTWEWKKVKNDVSLPDWAERFGHLTATFDKYVAIFGGCGPYLQKI